jgi:D-alanyl-lipoteichoic acid acyltransferase DltB (MBOAT superfamily)
MYQMIGIAATNLSDRLINPLRPSGNYMNHLLWQSVVLHFVFTGFVRFSLLTAIISLNSVNQLIFVMVKCGVLFEVRTGFLNNI